MYALFFKVSTFQFKIMQFVQIKDIFIFFIGNISDLFDTMKSERPSELKPAHYFTSYTEI